MPKIRRRTGRGLAAACLAGLVATCSSGAAFAQDPPDPGPEPPVRAALVPDPDAPLEEMSPGDPLYLWVGEPFWLAAEVSGASESDRLCVVWLRGAPEGEVEGEGEEVFVGSEAIEVGPGGDEPARLLFTPPHPELWRPAAYRALVFTAVGPRGCAGEPAAEVRFGIGEPATANGDPSPPQPPPPQPQPPEAGLPSFPWPAPEPLDFFLFSDRQLDPGGRPTTLGAVAVRLRTALVEGADYRSPRFYAVRASGGDRELLGFAMVTAVEQIAEDGRPLPEPDRWSHDFPSEEGFSLPRFFRALFEAPRGDYRVIAFVVVRGGLQTSGEEATRDEAEGWLSGGTSSLPPEIATLPYDARYETIALVYQFRKIGHHSDPIANPGGAPSARQHLDRTGILGALRRP